MSEHKKWRFSKLPLVKESNGKDYFQSKVNLLFSHFNLVGVPVLTIHIIIDSFIADIASVYIDIVFLASFLGFYLLNEAKYHKLARYLFLTFLNLSFFLIAASTDQDLGLLYLFFPLVAITYIFFAQTNNIALYFYLVLSVILIFTLLYTDLKPFGNVQFIIGGGDTFYILNIITSFFLLIFLVGFLVDLYYSTIKYLEEYKVSLEKLTWDIQSKNSELKKSNQNLDSFVYSTSHDLRAPLMSILGLVNIAKYNSEKDNQSQYFTMIEERILVLDHSIKNIIEFSRNSRLEISKESIDFNSIIMNTINSLNHIEHAEKIKFNYSVNFSASIFHDKNRIEVILNNLVGNAIKYHDFKKPEPFINIDIQKEGEKILISVSDNGKGIAKEFHEKIFGMFVRASESSKGSGLGLFIVKETIEKLKGSILVDSEPGKGSEFIATIPINCPKN